MLTLSSALAVSHWLQANQLPMGKSTGTVMDSQPLWGQPAIPPQFGKVSQGAWVCSKLQRKVTLLIPRSIPCGSWGHRHPSA